MSETNKTILRRLLTEAFGQGNLAAVDELVADDFAEHSPPPGIPADKAGVKQTVQMFRKAFPDMKLTIEDMIAEGDSVAVRIAMSGTHEGELMA